MNEQTRKFQLWWEVACWRHVTLTKVSKGKAKHQEGAILCDLTGKPGARYYKIFD